MRINQLPTLGGSPTTGENIAIDTSTGTYKIDYNALATAILGKLSSMSGTVSIASTNGVRMVLGSDGTTHLHSSNNGDATLYLTNGGNAELRSTGGAASLILNANGTFSVSPAANFRSAIGATNLNAMVTQLQLPSSVTVAAGAFAQLLNSVNLSSLTPSSGFDPAPSGVTYIAVQLLWSNGSGFTATDTNVTAGGSCTLNGINVYDSSRTISAIRVLLLYM